MNFALMMMNCECQTMFFQMMQTSRSSESWEEGRALCIGAGARLCTVEELMADEAQGTGCGFDSAFVWTSDDVGCVANQVSFQWKNPDFLSRNPDFLLKHVDFIIKHSTSQSGSAIRPRGTSVLTATPRLRCHLSVQIMTQHLPSAAVLMQRLVRPAAMMSAGPLTNPHHTA